MRMCELTAASRASFYRHWEKRAPTEAGMALRDVIQRMAVAHRFYGYRRVAVLVQREGYGVGAKKARNLMKEDNLLALRRRKFVATTEPAMGGRHHLCALTGGVRLSGRGAGRLLRACCGLGAGTECANPSAAGGSGKRDPQSPAQAWVGAPFRRWFPVCQQRLREAAGKHRGGFSMSRAGRGRTVTARASSGR